MDIFVKLAKFFLSVEVSAEPHLQSQLRKKTLQNLFYSAEATGKEEFRGFEKLGSI